MKDFKFLDVSLGSGLCSFLRKFHLYDIKTKYIAQGQYIVIMYCDLSKKLNCKIDQQWQR